MFFIGSYLLSEKEDRDEFITKELIGQTVPKAIVFNYNKKMFSPLDQLHHALIVTGNRTENLDGVKKYLVSNEIIWQGNQDVLIFDQEQILMDDAHKIINFVSSKKLGAVRFCIISTDRMATDVQNRLLKSIEEPQEGTHFVLLVPNLDRILPTILSRAQVIEGSGEVGGTRLNVSEFLKAATAGRFTLIESWTKAKKDDDNLSKSEIVHFFDQLEKELWDKKNKDEALFADIRKMREYAGIRGASHRVLLDYISMVCPVIK
jgi:hypothetical protein